VHYVYILAEPIMILSTIAGAMTSLAIVAIFGGGTESVISPGSLISVVAMSPGVKYLGINVGAVFAGALVSFGVASFIMIFKRKAKVKTTTVNVTAEGINFEDQKETLLLEQQKGFD
jgi:PTS system mannitol-specific IIC component